MSVIAEIQIEGGFVLNELLTNLPDVPIQLGQVVPAGERTIPLIWIHTDEPEPVEQHLRQHRLIETITQLDRFEDRALYRIEWAEEPNSVFEELRSKRTDLLDAVGAGEFWTFELRFLTHEALSVFHSHCRDAGISLTVNRVYRPSESESMAGYGLTDIQYDTLLQALEGGYFNVPREMTLKDLGAQLGVSDQAVTVRIRRGLTNVLTHTLMKPDEH